MQAAVLIHWPKKLYYEYKLFFVLLFCSIQSLGMYLAQAAVGPKQQDLLLSVVVSTSSSTHRMHAVEPTTVFLFNTCSKIYVFRGGVLSPMGGVRGLRCTARQRKKCTVRICSACVRLVMRFSQ